MLICLLILCLFIIGLVGCFVRVDDNEKVFVCGLALGLLVIFVAVVTVDFYVHIPIDIEQFIVTQETLEAARNDTQIDSLELATLQKEVIEMNKWLKEIQFKKRSIIYNWTIPKSVLELKPIR